MYYHYYQIYKENVRVPKHKVEIAPATLMALLINYADTNVNDSMFTDEEGNIDYNALDKEFSRVYTEADNAIDTEEGLDCGDYVLFARYKD